MAGCDGESEDGFPGELGSEFVAETISSAGGLWGSNRGQDGPMGGQRVRKVTTFLCMSVLIGSLVPGLGYAKKKDDSPKDLFEPQRLTAGASNQFMGSFTGDGKALYFVSDTNVSTEIFVQDPVESGAELRGDLLALRSFCATCKFGSVHEVTIAKLFKLAAEW